MTAALTAEFKTEPFLHQLREFELSADMPERALIWTMRTGKTKVIIDTACHLYSVAKTIDAVLVIAPNGVHENWATRELSKHHWDGISYSTFFWRTEESKSKDYQARFATALQDKTQLQWFCMASQTMTRDDVRKFIKRIVNRRKVLVIFDESQDFRTPGSKRTSMARALSKKCLYKRILSGTPVDNSPLHAWSQYELLQPGALGFSTFGDFKDHFAVYTSKQTKGGRSYPVLDFFRNLDELRDSMAPFTSVVLREDCPDLPELVLSTIDIELTETQIRIYKDLVKHFETEVNGELISIGEFTTKMVKLQQVVSGYVKDEYGEVRVIDGPNPRLEALLREVYLSSGRVIIWCQFRHDIDLVVEALRNAGREVVEYHGRISADEKQRVREVMSPEAGEYGPDLVGQAQSGGSGLDFSAASKIIWYSHTFDAIVRGQADERATAVGGANIPVINLVAPGVDEYILETTTNKISVADKISRQGLKSAIEALKL